MNNLFKKVFTFGVVATTILWSLGVAALVPAVAQADDACIAGLVAGDMVKVASSPTIYVLDSNLKVTSFVNNTTSGTGSSKLYFSAYKTWNADSNYSFKTVSFACIEKLGSSAKFVGYRPGTQLVKHPITGSIYAVGLNRVGYKLTDAVAKSLYGTNYKLANPSNQEFGAMFDSTMDWTEAVAHPGMFVKKDSKTYVVNADKTLTEITAEGLVANRVNSTYVRTLDAALLPAVGSAAPVTAYSATLADRSQSGVANAGTGTTASGALTVALSANTPAATNLAAGTAFNQVLKVTLTAGPEAVTVKGITLKKSGYINNNKITGVDVIDGSDVRHGNVASSINSDGEVTILFGSSPVVVSAGSSVTLTVRVNLASDAGSSTVKMGVKSVDSTAATVGGLPVYGNEFNSVSASNSVAAVQINVKSVGGTGTTNLNADADNEQEITKFNLSETSSNEDALVYGLTFFNYGNAADSDYKDVQLVTNDGTVLATVQPSSQYVTFNLASAPYRIKKGENKDLTVRAKIVNGSSKTIQFVVYNDYDLAVKGSDTGAFVLPTSVGNDTTFPCGDTYNKVQVSEGTMTFNKDTSSPSTATNPGATNVVLAKYYAKPVGENMELRRVSLGITQNSMALNGNVYVKVNDANVWSGAASTFATSSAAVAILLNTYPTLTAGVNNYITIEANINSSATAAAYYQTNLDLTEVKKLISNSISDPGVGVSNGNIININAGSLSVKTLSTPVAQNVVAGSNNFEFARFELSADTSGEDVRVSSFVISDNGTGTVTHIGNLAIYNGSTQLTTSNNTSNITTASTTFNLTNALVIAKGQTVTLSLKGDVLSGATGGNHKFSMHSVNATGKDTGNTVDVTPTGLGQAMALATAPTVTLSLVSGSNASPSTAKVVSVGTNDGTYFAFKVTPQNDAVKVRTIKLTATGTNLNQTTLKNIRLYKDNDATAFASTAQMACSSNTCTASWNATDNLLPAAIQPGTPVTIYVKSDVGGQGEGKLGDDFKFSIAATSTDFIAVGANTANSATITGTPTASGKTSVVPFTVKVEGVSPSDSGATIGLSSGATVGIFKVTNLGGAQVSLTKANFGNGGSATTAVKYDLKYSVDGGSQTDITGGTASSTAVSANFGTFTTPVTINGGSWRYLIVKTNGVPVNNDSFQLSVSNVGDLQYSVADSDLGYDGNVDGNPASGSSSALSVDGTPSVGTVTAKS